MLKNIINKYVLDKNDEQWLFKSQKGEDAITRIQAYRILKNATLKIDLQSHIGTHSLRKTFGYHFYKKTKDIALLQKILNHSSPNITMRYIGITQDIIDSQLYSFSL